LTHLLQVADVGLFSILKSKALAAMKGKECNDLNFWEFVGPAWNETMTVVNIQQAFKQAGHWPPEAAPVLARMP